MVRESRSLMGVPLQEAAWSAAGEPPAPAVNPSPEVRACRAAFDAMLAAAVPLAAVTGNLDDRCSPLVRINSIAGKPAVFGRFDAAQAVLMRRRA